MIHCALCFHDPGDRYKTAYCALLSCFEHTSERIHVHVLIDDSAREGRPWLEDLCSRYGHSISFYEHVTIPQDVLDTFPGGYVAIYTEASLYRMCLHEQLPEDVDRVIYFDFDVIFERDIADLWNMELGDAWMLAAHDPSRRWSRAKKGYYLKALDIDEHRYFNSGVLLINLKALREASKNGNIFWKAYMDGAPLFRTLNVTVFDQDLLNHLLSRDREKLLLTDESFNYELCLHDRRFLRMEELTGKILHFPALKPWEKLFPAQLVYWKYYNRTPWADEVFPLIEARIFDPTDRIWPFLMWLWRRHASLRWLARLRGCR